MKKGGRWAGIAYVNLSLAVLGHSCWDDGDVAHVNRLWSEVSQAITSATIAVSAMRADSGVIETWNPR